MSTALDQPQAATTLVASSSLAVPVLPESTPAPDSHEHHQQYHHRIQRSSVSRASANNAPADTAVDAPNPLVVLRQVSFLFDVFQMPNANQLTPFHSSVPVGVALPLYAHSIAHYTGYGSHGLAIAFALMMRRSAVVGELPNALTVHRLLLTCLTVGCKVNFDVFVSNGHVARIGGVPVAELNRMERALLAELGWRVIPTVEELTLASSVVEIATARPNQPSACHRDVLTLIVNVCCTASVI